MISRESTGDLTLNELRHSAYQHRYTIDCSITNTMTHTDTIIMEHEVSGSSVGLVEVSCISSSDNMTLPDTDTDSSVAPSSVQSDAGDNSSEVVTRTKTMTNKANVFDMICNIAGDTSSAEGGGFDFLTVAGNAIMRSLW